MVGEPEDIDVEELEFDEHNISHLAQHGVSREAVEEVQRNAPRYFRNLPDRSGSHVMIGPDENSKFLLVVLRPPATTRRWRPVTAWPLGRRGPRLYDRSAPNMTERITDEEIIRYYEDLKAKGHLFDNLVEVKAKVSKNPRSIWSLPLMPGELTEIERAAKAHKVSISDFIRKAALSAVAGDLNLDDGEKVAAIEEVRQRLRELSRAVKGL